MAPKVNKKLSEEKLKSAKEKKTNTDYTMTSDYIDSEDAISLRCISLDLELNGNPPTNDDYALITLFNGTTILEGKWNTGVKLSRDVLPINLNENYFQMLVASNPIIFLLRALGGKPSKQEADPLLNSENRAAATVDLLPLLLGEEEIFTTVRLMSITTGKFIDAYIEVRAVAPGMTEYTQIPLSLTMISAHCMPSARDGTVYISALGLTGIHIPRSIDFGQSLSTGDAKKIVWATVSAAGQGAKTELNVPDKDLYIPEDLDPKESEQCRSFYWNAMNRVLVDSQDLIITLSSPFLIELAGVPKTGKVDVRGHYMGWVDARALLEPGQLDVTVCATLLYYSDSKTLDIGGALLELPPTSAKATSARESDFIFDDYKHNAYVVIRFDLTEALVPKPKLISLYDIIGYPQPDGHVTPIEQLDTNVKAEDPIIDAKYVRKEAGALAVHKELSKLACRGGVPMNQSIKRSAANHLLVRIRTMLRNFAPGNCSYIDWQDTVTRQHAASRRAVTASFAPQPPQPHVSSQVAIARSRSAGDNRLAERHVKDNLKVGGSHPRSLMCKAIRCLEERNDLDAKNYLYDALNRHPKNKYLLWILGAQEFDQGPEGVEVAEAAFRIAAKGDYSDGTTNAISWAAVHALYHTNDNLYGAHVAIRNMRKSFELPVEWKKVLKRWSDISGEEEFIWSPSAITPNNPILIAATFFLCLRCYKFSETLLQCVERNCATRGSNRLKYVPNADLYYLRSASFILRRQVDRALELTLEGIQKFGPSALMSQMRLTCVAYNRDWDAECEKAFEEAEKAGSKPCLSMVYKAALSRFKTNPQLSLQRAALVHKLAPSGHTALLIGRIYFQFEEYKLAERWCSCAVKIEPLLADGWAMLSILAMYDKQIDRARTMLRTARQVGPITHDIGVDVKKLKDIVELDQLPDCLVKDLCLRKDCE